MTVPLRHEHSIFQSTLSMRRATGTVQHFIDTSTRISIHALHEESDVLHVARTLRGV